MALGGRSNNRGIYLSIAGGFVWNKRADETDPNFSEQEYPKQDGTKGIRKGACYKDVTGKIVNVYFSSHKEYGDQMAIALEDGDEKYIIQLGVDNRICSDMMKMLLKIDRDKLVTIKPYDFVGDAGKRITGLTIYQDGNKIPLRIDEAPFKDAEWFKTVSKREMKRFFEDVTDYFVQRVKAEVIPAYAEAQKEIKETETAPVKGKIIEPAPEEVAEERPAVTSEPVQKATPLKMKRSLTKYISENFPGKSLPMLTPDELIKWYDASLRYEELPFEEAPVKEASANGADLEDQLNKLL